MYKRLVYRSDDVGYTLAFDLGVFKGIDEGITTSADVMLDSPHTEEALRWLKERPWISIGWHRHLWESPVADKSLVPHMVDEEGRFKWRHKHQELMGEVPYAEAMVEFEAELKRCYEILGRYPDTTTYKGQDNELERAFRDVCEKYDIHMNICGGISIGADPKYEYLNYNAKIAFPPGDRANPYDLTKFSEYDTVKNIKALTWSSPEEIVMFGGHPGFLDDHIFAESRCTIHRLEELRGCIDPEVKKWIVENKIELVNQRDVLYGTSEYQDHLKAINSPLWSGNF